MDKNIKELLERYNAGITSREDLKQIEQLLEKGSIDLLDLNDFQQLDNRLQKVETPEPSLLLDDRFYQMLQSGKRVEKGFSWRSFFSWPQLAPKLALASVTLIIGLVAGYFLRSTSPTLPSNDRQMELLTQQVTDLKEMMMLSLLEKESATDRLKAVNLTQEMDQASKKVTTALLETLNHDGNVNVRLAALDALKPYVRDSEVRKELVESIALQDSPLVQIALAELMAALQVKSSVEALEKLLQNEKTPKDVKKKIRESIEVII